MRRANQGRQRGSWLRAGGLLLMVAALLLTAYNLWDERRAGVAAGQVLDQLLNVAQTAASSAVADDEIPDYLLNPGMDMPTVKIDGNLYIGTLELPTLDLALPVMSDWSYSQLRVAPCRYAGTAYQGNFVIAAHNYLTHFGALATLAVGDRVIFTDVDGNLFTYAVAEVQILNPTALEEMVSDDWDLSLFTCTTAGTARLTVRCEKIVAGA